MEIDFPVRFSGDEIEILAFYGPKIAAILDFSTMHVVQMNVYYVLY